MPLNRFDFGHLYGEKTYSSFGLVSFSLPVTFIKSMENPIKVVSRHFKHFLIVLFHFRSGRISSCTLDKVSWQIVIFHLCKFVLLMLTLCIVVVDVQHLPTTFFVLAHSLTFRDTFSIHTCLSYYVHTLQTFINTSS